MIADGFRHDGSERDADDHGDQHESLAHGIGLGAVGIRLEHLGEQSRIVGVDHGIDGAGEGIHQQAVDEQGIPRQGCRRAVEEDQPKHLQRGGDRHPGLASTPARAGAVRKEPVYRVVDGIQKCVQEQQQGELGCGQPQGVHVEDGRIGFEHVDGDG